MAKKKKTIKRGRRQVTPPAFRGSMTKTITQPGPTTSSVRSAFGRGY